jgi:hypothetical protein
MTFKAGIQEIDNGFMVETIYMGEHPEHSSRYTPTFEAGIAEMVARYKKWSQKPSNTITGVPRE